MFYLNILRYLLIKSLTFNPFMLLLTQKFKRSLIIKN